MWLRVTSSTHPLIPQLRLEAASLVAFVVLPQPRQVGLVPTPVVGRHVGGLSAVSRRGAASPRPS